ncbi:hypothetical protein Poli38472_009686 [Pythium oligandrum]|uniref:Uncharacterized protein n=1 Tax=Pythium oligandrum TaxID=41045 RepID=A0A8K1CFQ8_PYTOL|nr:hypothetical protein Poli38472_009686 [Pythium oligandrum]|eukprot:TMW62193.1 hypothetical protein Poli38472_009686 [Pythium oligandrum]
MTRVAVLAHVKESTIVEPPASMRSGPRIPWSGGKIKSNKEEALRKFYARKLEQGAQFTPEQLQAMEATLGSAEALSHVQTERKHKTSKHDVVHKKTHVDPRKKHDTHRAHAKVQPMSKRTLLVSGRVVGPRVTKVAAKNGNGRKMTSKKQGTDALPLHDQLDMPLDALVKRRS